MDFTKPKIIISKCLGFEACYYNGQIFNIDFLKKLDKYVEYYPICPEMEIGLGVPRQTIRIVYDKENDRLRLVQPKTKKDLTQKMHDFSKGFSTQFDQIDGFIFKEGSPSCGNKDIKVYSGIEGQVIHKNAVGLFAKEAFEIHPEAAVETSGRLNNLKIREHFLIKIFLLARFREVKENKKMKDLIKFHADNKYLFMAYNQNILKEMGKITANHEKIKIEDVLSKYETKLNLILKEYPNFKSIINVLNHIFGYFKNNLSHTEKQFFLDIVEKYRNNKVPLSVPIHLLRSWIIEYDVDYLKDQSFINPFPEDLIDLTDSGKDRDRL
ncbi:MAG: YbgA family protein [Bacillota bacterium]